MNLEIQGNPESLTRAVDAVSKVGSAVSRPV